MVKLALTFVVNTEFLACFQKHLKVKLGFVWHKIV